MVLVLQFTLAQVLDDALVGSSRREERGEGQGHVDGGNEQQDTEEEVQTLVLKQLVETEGFRQARGGLFGL